MEEQRKADQELQVGMLFAVCLLLIVPQGVMHRMLEVLPRKRRFSPHGVIEP